MVVSEEMSVLPAIVINAQRSASLTHPSGGIHMPGRKPCEPDCGCGLHTITVRAGGGRSATPLAARNVRAARRKPQAELRPKDNAGNTRPIREPVRATMRGPAGAADPGEKCRKDRGSLARKPSRGIARAEFARRPEVPRQASLRDDTRRSGPADRGTGWPLLPVPRAAGSGAPPEDSRRPRSFVLPWRQVVRQVRPRYRVRCRATQGHRDVRR